MPSLVIPMLFWYAMGASSPHEQDFDLRAGVTLKMTLVPADANKAPRHPRPPHDERPAGQWLMAVSASIFVGTAAVWAQRWRRNRTKPQFSLRLLMFITLAAALGAFGYSKFAASQRALEAHWKKHPVVAHDDFPLLVQPLPLLIGKFEVTVEQYERVSGQRLNGAPNEPASGVTWQEANAFCRAWSAKLGREFRLPWEREWEYACRADTRTNFSSGNSQADLGCVAWYLRNSSGRVHPVGLKAPNAFGIYDMHGNVSEWVLNGQRIDDHEPDSFWMHGIRGGSYGAGAMFCESRTRYVHRDDARSPAIGFRVLTYSLPNDEITYGRKTEPSDDVGK